VLDPVESHLSLELIDDSYNANPNSAGAAIEVLAAASVQNGLGRMSRGRRIAVLGDMKELGATEAAMHKGLADLPALKQIDRVFCVGPLMQHLFDALPDPQKGHWTNDSSEMAAALPGFLDAGDVVLVKGSLSMKLALVVDAIHKMGHPRGIETEL
jgi:UDP-N-acetylmuramoyl-tripeptide--D-alanyl-D-alanine ligase